MDRLNRIVTGGALALFLGSVVTASGCRSMHGEVPPGKPYSTTGGSPPSVGFNSDPRPNTAANSGLYGNSPVTGAPGQDPTGTSLGSGQPQFGTPAPGSQNYGAPTSNLYGQPGTTGIAPGLGGGSR
jgi:hypothetical protein